MITNLLQEKMNVIFNITSDDLKEFAKEIILQVKEEFETTKTETYVSIKKACEILNVVPSTLWRWSNANYLVPVTVGGKRQYKMSEINDILNNKK